jgi:hypothetical protein
MARYRKTRRRNKQTLLPRVRHRPTQLRVAQLRRLPWWADRQIMMIVDGKVQA